MLLPLNGMHSAAGPSSSLAMRATKAAVRSCKIADSSDSDALHAYIAQCPWLSLYDTVDSML
eukprot:2989304-Amphidinium_carterae.2